MSKSIDFDVAQALINYAERREMGDWGLVTATDARKMMCELRDHHGQSIPSMPIHQWCADNTSGKLSVRADKHLNYFSELTKRAARH